VPGALRVVLRKPNSCRCRVEYSAARHARCDRLRNRENRDHAKLTVRFRYNALTIAQARSPHRGQGDWLVHRVTINRNDTSKPAPDLVASPSRQKNATADFRFRYRQTRGPKVTWLHDYRHGNHRFLQGVYDIERYRQRCVFVLPRLISPAHDEAPHHHP